MSRNLPLQIHSALRSKPWAVTEQGLRTLAEIALSGELPRIAADSPPLAVMDRRGAPLEGTKHAELRDGVAIFHLNSVLVRHADWFTDMFGICTYEQLAQDFRRALDDSSVRAIALVIDSPGGEVNGCAEFAEQIFQARGRKPIVAIANDMAASAAYLIGAAADELVTTSSAFVGCIGVLCTIYDWKELLNAIGIREYTLVSSQTPKKNPDVTTPEGYAEIQRMLDESCAVFVATLAKFRGVDTAEMLQIASEGQTFVGSKAVEIGLASRVATVEAVLGSLSGRTKPAAPAGAVAPRHSESGTPAIAAIAADPQARATPSVRGAAVGERFVSKVTRTVDISEGDEVEVVEVREGATICAVTGPNGDSRWMVADDELAPVETPAEGATETEEEVTARRTAEAGARAVARAGRFLTLAAREGITLEQLQAHAPQLAESLALAGAVTERERIKGIAAAMPPGLEAVRDECLADPACTPATAAQRYLEAQSSGRGRQLSAIRNAELEHDAPAPLNGAGTQRTLAQSVIALHEQHSPSARRLKSGR